MRLGVHIAVSCAVTAGCALVVPLDDLAGNDAPDASDAASMDTSATDVVASDAAADVAIETGGDAPVADYASTILADGPLAYFRLDETTGTKLHDSSGNGHDATLSGGVALASAGALVGGPLG